MILEVKTIRVGLREVFEMNQKDFDALRPGDQIREKLSGSVYVILNDITEKTGERSYIVCRAAWAQLPSAWDLVAKTQPVEEQP